MSLRQVRLRAGEMFEVELTEEPDGEPVVELLLDDTAAAVCARMTLDERDELVAALQAASPS